MAHLMISAAHKSSGKTTISIGVCAALAARGLLIQPFKKGPDYIDPLWLGAAAGRSCYNLDFYTQERREITTVFARHMVGADIGIIEGNKGLYDGLDLDGSNSNAALAALLQAPVVLVLDTRGMTRGVAPLILGYQQFDPAIRIGGIILNHVGGNRHESKLRSVIEHYTDVRVLGALAHNPGLEIEERHLGLMPSNERERSADLIETLGSAVGDAVDLSALVNLAELAPTTPKITFPAPGEQPGRRVRLAFARDEAFGFYYPGDLEALELAGADLISFDTLRDRAMPAADGLFIGGGFPETRMRALAANRSLCDSVRLFIESGGPAYVECGGMMYLSRTLTWNEERCKMVGVVDADTVMHAKPQGRGYVRMTETDDHPWPGGHHATELSAHEFHYSGMENIGSSVRFAYRVQRGFGVDGRHDGIVYKNLLASYVHLRDTGANHWTQRFVDHIRAVGSRTGS